MRTNSRASAFKSEAVKSVYPQFLNGSRTSLLFPEDSGVMRTNRIPQRHCCMVCGNMGLAATSRRKQRSLCQELANHILLFLNQLSHRPPGFFQTATAHYFIENYSTHRCTSLGTPPPPPHHLASDFPEALRHPITVRG